MTTLAEPGARAAQIEILDLLDARPLPEPERRADAPDLASYDTIIVAMSGGKDSVACVLHLLECGVAPARIELWHHEIDGREGEPLMDWPSTPGYCRAFARAFDLPIYFSWKEGGFEREMNRKDARTAPIRFETPEGEVRRVGGERGKLSTRERFPQVSVDLSVRWCSSYLKIDVMSAALCNQDRFQGQRTLVVTGERAEESASRARYQTFEPHRSDNRGGARVDRLVDHWRPVHGWSEVEVWAIIERWGVNPHPAYHLGFGRCSCMTCIFGSADQWATIGVIAPERLQKIARYEERFRTTIHRSLPVLQRARSGSPYPAAAEQAMARIAMDPDYDEPIRLAPGEWRLPAGAFGESCGPI